jgi:preprotein translocase subunit SecA
VFPIKDHIAVEELEKLDRAGMKERLAGITTSAYEAKETEITPEIMRMVESQYIMLPIIDRLWVDHLYIMDALKSGIGLRGYGQKDPRVEYEKEAYEIFEDLKSNIADEAIKAVFAVRVERTSEDEQEDLVHLPNLNGTSGDAVPAGPAFDPLPTGEMVPQAAPRLDPVMAEKLLGPAPRGPSANVHTNLGDDVQAKSAATAEKVGRNSLCPCGSGKKFKRCHGAAA